MVLSSSLWDLKGASPCSGKKGKAFLRHEGSVHWSSKITLKKCRIHGLTPEEELMCLRYSLPCLEGEF